MTEPFATATIAELSPDEVVVPLRPVDAADAGPREALQPGDPELVRAYTGSRRMLRRGFFSDAADKWLFAFFAGLGIVAALGRRSMGVPWHPWRTHADRGIAPICFHVEPSRVVQASPGPLR